MSSSDPHQGLEFVVFADSLRDTFHLIVDYVHERLAQRGFGDVRPAHMAIFQHLQPEGSRIGELAQRSRLTNQSVGSLVDYLEQHGYVERRSDPRNRRATLVCFTERGWSEMRACAAILGELEERLNRGFGSDRLSELRARVTDLQVTLGELS